MASETTYKLFSWVADMHLCAVRREWNNLDRCWVPSCQFCGGENTDRTQSGEESLET